jgi:hypothetical protein
MMTMTGRRLFIGGAEGWSDEILWTGQSLLLMTHLDKGVSSGRLEKSSEAGSHSY